uniref:BPTI/Kunitz inhibitor domain-containing protein n=1 Tax=Hippocampus comes TaxID=109280 RepID=A0A3Q2YM51_HIPCM
QFIYFVKVVYGKRTLWSHVKASTNHCMAPKKIGPCRGAFPRWHYNAASQKCEGFVFGGCRENLNNYLSKDECTNACYANPIIGQS